MTAVYHILYLYNSLGYTLKYLSNVVRVSVGSPLDVGGIVFVLRTYTIIDRLRFLLYSGFRSRGDGQSLTVGNSNSHTVGCSLCFYIFTYKSRSIRHHYSVRKIAVFCLQHLQRIIFGIFAYNTIDNTLIL